MRTGIDPPRDPQAPGELLEGMETLGAGVEELVRRFPDFECLTLLDRDRPAQHVSLRAFHERAKQVQAALLDRGLAPGEAVVFALPTGVELVAAYFGAVFAGCVPGLMATPSHRVADPGVYRAMLENAIRGARAKALYCDPEVAGLVGEVLGVAVLSPGDVGPCAAAPPTVPRDPDDVAAIQFSSGTTGVPKGALLTHRAMLDYLRALRERLGLGADDVSVNWIPLYHDMGLLGAFLLPLLSGSPAVLIPNMAFLREPSMWLRAIDEYRGVLSWAPNFAFALCARRIPDEEIEGLDLSSWRIAASASEPVLAETIAEFAERFAPYGYAPETMTPCWGLAEAVMAATLGPVGEAPRVEVIDRDVLAREGRAEPTSSEGIASVALGLPLSCYELEIRDDAGRVLPDREVGSVWLRSSAVFSGYEGDPELTARVLVDGCVDTGDRGYRVDGQLYFVSRVKDLIIIGGENYVPHDVETAINRVPGVRAGCSVAFGVPNAERGTEELGAVAETHEEDPEQREVIARAIRTEVSRSFGIGVRHLRLVDPGGIVKTTSGKIARAATRERYAREFADG